MGKKTFFDNNEFRITGLVVIGVGLLVCLANILSASYLGVYSPTLLSLFLGIAFFGAWLALTNRGFYSPTEAPMWWKVIAFITFFGGLVLGILLCFNLEYFVDQTEQILRYFNLYDPFGLRHL